MCIDGFKGWHGLNNLVILENENDKKSKLVAVATVASSEFGDQGVTVDSYTTLSKTQICFTCNDPKVNEVAKEAGHFAFHILSSKQVCVDCSVCTFLND